MRRLRTISQVSCLTLVVAVLGVIGCKNGNLFGDRNSPGNSSDVAVLQSDAQIALDHKDYTSALSLYERILSGDPNNSNALNGAAIAAIGAAGLDFGTVLSNIVHQNGAAQSMGLADLISAARQGYSSQDVSPNSLLAGVDLVALDAAIDRAICRLTRIVSGMSDGVIKPTDSGVLIDLACLHLIRGVLRPIRADFFDIVNNNGSYALVQKANFNTVCGNPSNDGLVTASAQDLVDGYALFNKAALVLDAQSSSILGRLRQEMDDIISSNLGSGTSALPAACVTTINNYGITSSNFRSNTHAFQPDPNC